MDLLEERRPVSINAARLHALIVSGYCSLMLMSSYLTAVPHHSLAATIGSPLGLAYSITKALLGGKSITVDDTPFVPMAPGVPLRKRMIALEDGPLMETALFVLNNADRGDLVKFTPEVVAKQLNLVTPYWVFERTAPSKREFNGQMVDALEGIKVHKDADGGIQIVFSILKYYDNNDRTKVMLTEYLTSAGGRLGTQDACAVYERTLFNIDLDKIVQTIQTPKKKIIVAINGDAEFEGSKTFWQDPDNRKRSVPTHLPAFNQNTTALLPHS